jgi:predicted metal-dependent hydrolase
MPDGLPDYEIRRNRRARRVIVRMTRELEVVVTAPPRTSRRDIDRFLGERAEWLARTEALLRGQGCLRPDELSVPGEIRLQAVDRTYAVRLAPSNHAPALAEVAVPGPAGDRAGVTLGGDYMTDGAWRELLQGWLRARGRELLAPWLLELAREFDLPADRVQIRLQRSRWGSRSARGTVSLNARLLFLPRDVARYVLLHELCHGRHLDHSPRFWALLYSIEPRCHELDRALARTARRHVPAWAA